MITNGALRRGRMEVLTGFNYVNSVNLHSTDLDRIRDADFVLTGGLRIQEKVQVPHPGFEGYGDDDKPNENGVATLLHRDQAEHLAIELLKALNGGSMPDDSAELIDFISSLGR